MSRDLFARAALAQIPNLLTLQDRNAHSPTYGCFDRNFWHYKIIDFPSGMAAEFVWPLALAYSLDLPDNPYFRQAALRDWIEAGLLFAARSARADGSCDDYFPFEKASGAAAFSLLAGIETTALLGLQLPELSEFFSRRADWLQAHDESGRLTNHQALIALCLLKLGRTEAATRRLHRVLEWQDEEGWFAEYEGCDPGYDTLTLGLLAQFYELAPNEQLRTAITRSVRFLAHCVHPDGSFGGELGSRNTYNFFPHGFELVGRLLPEALVINDRFLQGLTNGLNACYADDHIIAHHLWSYLLAWRDWVPMRPTAPPTRTGRTYFARAGLLIERRGEGVLHLSLRKGGVFKFFSNEELRLSDTNFSVVTEEGNAVAHFASSYDCQIDDDELVISGALGWAKQKQMMPWRMIALRITMLTFGRFFPNVMRRLLQRVLITGKKDAPFHFQRTLQWQASELRVIDELRAANWKRVRAVGIGPAQTSIHVVMSRTWQAGQMQPWLDLTAQAARLKPGETLRLERTL